MKLLSVQLSDYKCIRKSCQFDISDITCLVGKNESGKTAILEALYRLNPVIQNQSDFNVDDDYPRIDVEDYRLAVADGKSEPAIVTRATFALEQGDLKKIEADFPGIIAQPELILSKGYANELYAELTINEDVVVEGLLKKAKLSAQALKTLVRCSTVNDLAEELKAYDKEEAAKHLLETIDTIMEKGLLQYLYEKYIEPKVPKFLYFDEFYQMKGHVNIQALVERKQNNRLLNSDYPLLGLIDLARLNLEEISNPRRALERDNRLEGASNHLTRSIMKYWSQNRHLELRFDIRPGLLEDPEGMQSGTNLWGHVYNSKQRVSTLLGRRSRGFVWFFSFLAWFSQQKRKNIPLILLLDEPSLFLHGSAQIDLLRFLEDECAQGLQVIYSTQSSYMVDPHRLDRVRVVEDTSTETGELSPASREGTQVFADATQARKESVLPLEGALGYALSHDLFPSPNVLVVEGVADLIFLHTMSSLLSESGRTGLDPRWAISPMGGAQHLGVFLALMWDNRDKKIACLLDQDTDRGSHLLTDNHIYSYADFCETAEAGIEDLFDPEFYVSIVNGAYSTALDRPLSKKHMAARGRKIVEQIEEHWESIIREGGIAFDRIKPVQYLAEHVSELKTQISNETLVRFEKVFRALNAALQ
ncbi:hypothetical protein ES708_10354 [subsurface metagenome]